METDNRDIDRLILLADIAEMYFIEGKNQSEIGNKVGMTRSNVSRLLKEAQIAGIVEFKINRPLQENVNLGRRLIDRFSLLNASVINVHHPDQLLRILGQASAKELLQHLRSGNILGTAWGSAISASIDQIEGQSNIRDLKVVQLIGAFGARVKEYDGIGIVRRLETKLDAEGIYIHAPFLVPNKQMAQSLLATKSVNEAVNMAKQADVALLGIGSIELEHSSYYLANLVTKEEILEIKKSGAIGDVCGRFFDINGRFSASEFQKRLIGISAGDLLDIPIRIGVAGGSPKVEPIIGALRGGLINVLISDAATIADVLDRTGE